MTSDHISPLAEVLQRRSLVPFVGADLPRQVSGLPSRADLARELAGRKGLDASLPLSEVAQRVGQAGNRWEFTDFIRNALDTTGKSPAPFHQRLASLVKEHQIEMVITTAYDNLLELAFQGAGLGINRVVRGGDVSFINPDRPTLIKLYGDAGQPDTLVVTDRDHSDLLRDRDREPLVDEVRRALRRNTVFFLGYNLADPDFRFLFDQVAESRFARTAYAVWPGGSTELAEVLSEVEVRMWRDRGIVILDVDPLAILSETEIPSAPHYRPEPMVTAPVSSSTRGDVMDYERGLDAFKQLAEGADWYQDFTIYEAPLRENLRDERRYGPSEQSRRDRARLIDQLNALALQHLAISFNDLCLGGGPPPTARPMSQGFKGDGPTAGPESTYYGTGQAWAVLVGVNHYEDAYIADLKVCVEDVTAIHHSLAEGYQVAKLLTDATPDRLPTRANVLGELSALAQSADENDLLLFYFSGHGKAEGGESYLLPRDTRLSAVKHTALAMRDVRELMDVSPARAKVIVLDACHSGAAIGKAEPTMTPEFIQRVFEEAEGMAVLASCKQGQQSWEWPEQSRSVFTYYLLDALAGAADLDQKGFVTVSDATRYVTDGVKRWAAQNGVPQTPTLQYTVAGDIILARPGPGTSG